MGVTEVNRLTSSDIQEINEFIENMRVRYQGKMDQASLYAKINEIRERIYTQIEKQIDQGHDFEIKDILRKVQGTIDGGRDQVIFSIPTRLLPFSKKSKIHQKSKLNAQFEDKSTMRPSNLIHYMLFSITIFYIISSAVSPDVLRNTKVHVFFISTMAVYGILSVLLLRYPTKLWILQNQLLGGWFILEATIRGSTFSQFKDYTKYSWDIRQYWQVMRLPIFLDRNFTMITLLSISFVVPIVWLYFITRNYEGMTWLDMITISFMFLFVSYLCSEIFFAIYFTIAVLNIVHNSSFMFTTLFAVMIYALVFSLTRLYIKP